MAKKTTTTTNAATTTTVPPPVDQGSVILEPRDLGYDETAIVNDLRTYSVTTIKFRDRNGSSASIIARDAFQSARYAMDTMMSSSSSQLGTTTTKTTNDDDAATAAAAAAIRIGPNVDSAHVTGYHGVNCMSERYNRYREGFVFSDNGLQIMLSSDIVPEQFSTNFENFHEILHDMAESVLDIISHHLQIPPAVQPSSSTTGPTLDDTATPSATAASSSSNSPTLEENNDTTTTTKSCCSPPTTTTSPAATAAANSNNNKKKNWFLENLGPFRTNSQWHIKRFVEPPSSLSPTPPNNFCQQQQQDDDNIKFDDWLPSHTDPSLISIVVHDYEQPTFAGLQFCCRHGNKKLWHNITNGCHSVAIVMIGSVLPCVTPTNYYFSACKHRVIYEASNDNQQRMAATLFVRPAPSARLIEPPSPLLLVVDEDDQQQQQQSTSRRQRRQRGPMTFEQWNARTARRYEKSVRSRTQRASSK